MREVAAFVEVDCKSLRLDEIHDLQNPTWGAVLPKAAPLIHPRVLIGFNHFVGDFN